MFNDVPITFLPGRESLLFISQISDTEVLLGYSSVWVGDHYLGVDIPCLTVSGQPYDVHFEQTDVVTSVWYGGREYPATGSFISGWIKGKSRVGKSNSAHNSPASPSFDCEINIDCTWPDNTLTMKITSIVPSSRFN